MALGRRPEEPDPFLGLSQQRVAGGFAIAGEHPEQCLLGRGQLLSRRALWHSPLRTMASPIGIRTLVTIAFTGVALTLAGCGSHGPAPTKQDISRDQPPATWAAVPRTGHAGHHAALRLAQRGTA